MTLQSVLTRVIRHTGVTVEELRDDGRMTCVVKARELFVLIAHDHCGFVPRWNAKERKIDGRMTRYSWPEIAAVLRPGKSHSTAITMYKRAKRDGGLVAQARVIAGGG